LLSFSPLLYHPYQISEYLALFLGLIGLVGIFVSLKKYISTPKGFSDLFFEGVKPKLQTKGLHGRVRHPIYLFTFLAIWSVFLYKPYLSILVVDCVITIYTLVAIRFEEQKLISLYGQEYEDYRKRVPMILPF
jgi:protein-S-isoprenylcysteine O-methyltransferase Ste14